MQAAGDSLLPPRLLRDGEQLIRTFIASSPTSLLERAILGSGVQHLRRCIVALTTVRIVQIAVNRDLTPRGALSQISWGDVKSFQLASLRRTLTITFRNGNRQRFSDLAFADVQVLRELLPDLVGRGMPTAVKEREALCAACLTSLRPASGECPNCHAPMKRRAHAVRLAWWSAGGGYHYLGFPQMAVLAGMIEIFFFAAFLLALATSFQRHGLIGAIGVLSTTVLFIEWKAMIVAHTASLASEITLDASRRPDGEETLFDVIEDAMRWIYGVSRRDTAPR